MASGAESLKADLRALRIRFRRDLQAQPRRARGRRYWVIKDPASLRYFELRDEEHFLWRQLDGRQSLEEIQAAFERKFAPRRLGARQLHAFVTRLHADGLVVADSADQGSELLRRGGEARRRELLSAAVNVLAIRFRGVDPDRFLKWLYGRCHWLFSPACMVVCVALMLTALALCLARFDELRARLPDMQSWFTLHNLLALAAVLAVTKVLHELGHALTLVHYGGECHELGAMLLVFTPCLYCNVSDAWMLPSKWQRMAISGAGMFVELTLASIATILWWHSEPGLFHALCLNVMVVCSFSTLLINGNPLLRYDGYFLLSDMAETPNLQQQASEVIRRTLTRWFLGIEPRDSMPTPDVRPVWLGLYGAASWAYRWVVLAGILWFLYHALKPHGLAIVAEMTAALAAGGWLAAPLVGIVGFMRDPWKSHRANWPRAGLLTLFCLAVLVVVLVLPLPYSIYAPVVLEPADAVRVYVTSGGTLVESRQPGETVAAGDVVARLEDRDLERELTKLRGERDRQQLHLRSLERRRVQDPTLAAEIPTAREALAGLEQRLQKRQADADRLLLRAEKAGVILSPRDRPAGNERGELPDWSGSPLDLRNRGSYLQPGSVVCLIGEPTKMQAVLLVDQADVEFVAPGQNVRLLLDQYQQQTLSGTVRELARVDLKVAPRELVAERELPVRVDAQGVHRPAQAAYQVRVTLADHDLPLLHGAIGRARIRSAPQSLAQRAWRAISRTFRIEL